MTKPIIKIKIRSRSGYQFTIYPNELKNVRMCPQDTNVPTFT